MKTTALLFDRPPGHDAVRPPESRGLQRDEVRLLVSTLDGHHHTRFLDLPQELRRGDVLVVNRSRTLAASLPAEGPCGSFLLNLCTHYGDGLWLAEPRWAADKPGPLPLQPGDRISACELQGRMGMPYPGLPRLWFVRLHGDVTAAMGRCGRPIRYGYAREEAPLESYQTAFATEPGSVEMPSAARPFSPRVLAGLRRRGVRIAEIVLHTGVSSLEVEEERVEDHPVFPEPFRVEEDAAEAVNAARAAGRRVVAVGTTVVRALESAWDGRRVRACAGYSRRLVHPGCGVHTVDGLLTGLHEPRSTHLAMLYALAGEERVRSAYTEAIRAGYLWHEFGDSHLLWAGPP